MTVTFFGHRDAPDEVKEQLCVILEWLICQQGATCFLVGNQGRFDGMVWECLSYMKKRFSHIHIRVVLAYFPCKQREDDDEKEHNTIYPEGLEKVPQRFAIDHRNRWMIDQSDIVVVYAKHSFGGAGKFKEIAQRKNKIVINLAE